MIRNIIAYQIPHGWPYSAVEMTALLLRRQFVGCGPIIADTFALDIDDPAYPREWRYDDGRPVCTAFEAMDAAGGPSVAVRDDETADMFGADHA